MIIEKKNTADLLPADYNPRKDLKPGDAEYEKLKRSIEQFGYVEPVIWNQTTGRVVGGHQRLKVLMDMGMTEVDCVVVSMDEEKEKALNIALNKISGDWDKDKLALLIADLQGADFDVSLTGFEPAEIDALFKDTLKDGIKEDDFDVGAELEKPTMTKSGDIWMLGRHRLVCGDSTKAETYDLLMGSTKANLVITDPPYNVNYEGSAGKIKNDNMADEAFYTFLLDAYTQMHAAMADDASIYVFHADTEGLNFRRAFADAGFYLSGCCIWKKQSLVLGRSPYQWQHELRLDRYEGFPTFYYKKELRLPIKGIKTGKVRVRDTFVYIMDERRPLGIPSRMYMQTCLEGYRDFGFDRRFLMDAYLLSAGGAK